MKPEQLHRCTHRAKGQGHCRANAQTGSEFCFFHDPALASERAAARKAGGIARTRKAVLCVDVPDKPLKTVADIANLLGETIHQVRRGQIDLRVSNAVGYLSGILLGAIEKVALEERVATLEAIVSAQAPTEPKDEGNYSFVFEEASGGEDKLR